MLGVDGDTGTGLQALDSADGENKEAHDDDAIDAERRSEEVVLFLLDCVFLGVSVGDDLTVKFTEGLVLMMDEQYDDEEEVAIETVGDAESSDDVIAVS